MTGPVSLHKAWLYERHRLPYAHEAMTELLAWTGPVAVAADVGAGTGQLARLLGHRVGRVLAIEPDPAMRGVGMQVLAEMPAVEFVDGTAEATTLADHGTDLIVVGSAYHRFRAEACTEFARILRPPGRVALFSYTFTDRAFIDTVFPKLAALPGLAARMTASWRRLPLEALFGSREPVTSRCPQTVTETWEAFFGAACAGIEAPERDDPEFPRFEQINREAFAALAVDGRLTVHYETCLTYGLVEPS